MTSPLNRLLDTVTTAADIMTIGRSLDAGRITPDQASTAIKRLGNVDEAFVATDAEDYTELPKAS